MRFRMYSLAAFATALAVACADEQPTSPRAGALMSATASGAKTYVIVGTGNALPADIGDRLSAAGGDLTAHMTGIGVAIATSDDAGFAGRAAGISGVQSVAEDVMIDFGQPRVIGAVEISETEISGGAQAVGAVETFRAAQWAPDAVSAPAAWDAGYMGAGARVAILDGGIHNTHIDIAAVLDAALSTSFVPNQPYNYDQKRNTAGQCVLDDDYWHGTHVAGIVAAPANNLGTVGIAPQATVIGVKVLHCGSGAFSWILQGIYYAATPIAEGGAGAHIINMSLGAGFYRQGPAAAGLWTAVSRATTYAYQRGVTVIVAAGNNAIDLDHTANVVFVPAMSEHVIAVSATGPLGWGQDPTVSLDRPASYTNYGQSAITLAGPGGDFVLPGSAICSRPANPSGTVLQWCWALDMVIGPCRGQGTSNIAYCWGAGTSMAAPAVAGVAALIIGKYGPIHPAQVEALLRQSADDLGKPGNDDWYGRGRVNAWRAVQ